MNAPHLPINEVDIVIVPIFTGADTEAPKVIADPGTANREWDLHNWNPSKHHTGPSLGSPQVG